jgi:hypothetical protein
MNRFKGATVALSLLAVTAVAAPAGALAADAGVTGTVTGGDLSLTTSATPSFAATLNGTDQAKTFSIPSVLSDTRGSGAGWNTTITSTLYTTGGGSPQTLAADASTMTSLISACQSGAVCTDETSDVALPVAVPAGATAPTAVKYHNAATDTGMGVFDHEPTVSVALPANTFAGSYTSTITLASVSGP